MKTSALLVTVALFGSSAMQAQDSLTVARVVTLTIERHPAIRTATFQAAAATARAEGSAAPRMPEAGFEGSINHVGPVPELVFGSSVFRLFPENNYDAHFGARYTVYDFGKTYASIATAESRAAAAEDVTAWTKQGLAYQAARTFYAILVSHHALRVADEQIETLVHHSELTQRKVEAGTATDFDVVTTQVRVASARIQRADRENALRQQESVLRQIVGMSEGTPIVLKGDFAIDAPPANVDSLVRAALAARLDLKLARDAERTAELQLSSSGTADLPTLRVNALWGIKNGYIPNLDILRGNWVVGAQLQWPLYDGGKAAAQVQESQAGLFAERSRVEDVERQVRGDVERALTDISTAQEKLTLSELQVQQSLQAVSVAQKRYESGSGTNVDLLDAETASATARLNQLESRFRLVVSRLELDRVTGATLRFADREPR